MNAKVLGIFLLLVALCAFLSFYTPDSFLKGNNIENLIRRTSMYGVLGIGVAFVIITGGIDLAIGSLVCLSGCLLALFLGVDYLPFDGGEITQVSSTNKTVIVSDAYGIEVGDTIRYYGGRRAKNALLTVNKITSDGGSTILAVDEEISRDDTTGKVAKMLRIASVDAGDMDAETPVYPTVVLNGAHSELAKRDQIWFLGGR